MEIVGFVLLLVIGLPVAIIHHRHLAEESAQACQALKDQVEREKQEMQNMQDVDVSRYEDEYAIMDSVMDYMNTVKLNEMQLNIRNFIKNDISRCLTNKDKLLREKMHMQDIVKNNEAYAYAYEEAENKSITGVEPYIVFFGWMVLSLFLCVFGFGDIGFVMLVIIGPIIGIVCLIASTFMSENRVTTRHNCGIYDKDRDTKDHIDAAVSGGMAIHTIHKAYKMHKETAEYFQHKHDF